MSLNKKVMQEKLKTILENSNFLGNDKLFKILKNRKVDMVLSKPLSKTAKFIGKKLNPAEVVKSAKKFSNYDGVSKLIKSKYRSL